MKLPPLPPMPGLAEFEAKWGTVKRRMKKPRALKRPPPTAENLFAMAWADSPEPGVPMEREFKGIPGRDFRFDFAFPSRFVAVELDGRGRHQSVMGERTDMEKGRLAIFYGWRVLHWQSMEAKNAAEWVEFVKLILRQR